jgi:tetratricopeptide (TPR) repeat protein
MSDRQQLAEHATGLGVVGLATMGLNAAPLIPLAVLAAWGIDRYKSCSQRKQRDTINRVIKQIEKANPDHRAVGPALALLKENRHKVAVSPTTLAEAEKRGNFPDTLYDIVFAGVGVPKDDGIEALLRMVLTAAWQELRLEDDYHKVFVQESVTALERDLKDGFARIEARLGDIRDDTRALRAGQEDTHAMLQELLRRTGGFPAAVEQADTLSLDELKTLAQAFGETELASPPELLDFLAKKAEEYRAYRATIDGLDDRVAAIQNLKGAAQDAADRLDFDEVEALLSRVDEVETEIAAETKVARAKNALLRNDPDTAFRLLSAAADSFASVDPLEPARRRAGYAELLYQHGLRYPGSALARAEQMLRDALATSPHATDAELWARLQSNLGTALRNLGTREGDTAALQDAVTALRAALEVLTREASPIDWAGTQNNLGTALGDLGTRAGDTAALQDAVTAFRVALDVTTRETSPMQWAMTQNNLGIALANLGTRAGDTAALQDAVTAYRAALEVYTREASPMDWAMTQNNLGNALADLGTRANDSAALQDAITAHRAALEVYTRETSPMDWAMTQNNLGTALADLGTRAGDTAALQDAVTAFRAALQVRTADAAPFPHAETMENLTITHLSLATLPDPLDPAAELAAARQAIDAALAIYTPKHTPYHHEQATRLRERILAAQAALG